MDDLGLAHELHCEYFMRLLGLHFPDFAEATLSDGVENVEHLLGHFVVFGWRTRCSG